MCLHRACINVDGMDSTRSTVVAQLVKTKMCISFSRGLCSSTTCRFAHSTDELREPPDLLKTAICRAFLRGKCVESGDCNFAHGEDELRVSPNVYKTQLCNFFARGHCKKGDRCRHAHGWKELRNQESEKSPTSSFFQAPPGLPPSDPSPSVANGDGTATTVAGDAEEGCKGQINAINSFAFVTTKFANEGEHVRRRGWLAVSRSFQRAKDVRVVSARSTPDIFDIPSYSGSLTTGAG